MQDDYGPGERVGIMWSSFNNLGDARCRFADKIDCVYPDGHFSGRHCIRSTALLLGYALVYLLKITRPSPRRDPNPLF
jgi:hypothetical protein